MSDDRIVSLSERINVYKIYSILYYNAVGLQCTGRFTKHNILTPLCRYIVRFLEFFNLLVEYVSKYSLRSNIEITAIRNDLSTLIICKNSQCVI